MKHYCSFLSSLFAPIIYLLFANLALTSFPGNFSPQQNWLSDLGSSQLNPEGAIFYNLGIIFTGITLLPFFLGLRVWLIKEHKTQNIMVFLTQLFGCLGAVAMVMSALFPITVTGAHSFWSAALYIVIGTAFAFSVAALRYYPRYPKWLLAVGVLIAVEDMLWGTILNTYLVEWITVALFLAYVLLLGIVTRQKEKYIADPH
jgi:hypothetical membrane protein